MINQPLVSIALCTYNGELFLTQQLDSLIYQSYKNLEIIIVDDNSIDNTFDICAQYAKKDCRIKLYRNQNNLGFNLNFAKAISLCKGEYIAISDQDDIWIASKIEILLNQWQNETVLIHHSVKEFYFEPLPSLEITKPRDAGRCVNAKYLLMWNFIQGCTILFKRNIIDDFNLFNKEIYYDWLIGVLAFKKGKIQYCNQNLLYHRRHSGSAYFSEKRERAKVYRIQMQNIDYFLQSNLLNEEETIFAKRLHEALREPFQKRYAFKTMFFFMKERKYAFWEKNKKYPFLSNLFESIKRGRGFNFVIFSATLLLTN